MPQLSKGTNIIENKNDDDKNHLFSFPGDGAIFQVSILVSPETSWRRQSSAQEEPNDLVGSRCELSFVVYNLNKEDEIRLAFVLCLSLIKGKMSTF